MTNRGGVNQYTVTNSRSWVKVANSVSNRGGTDTLAKSSIQFSDRSINLTMATKAASISASNLNSLIALYIAYLNRVPEATGLSYWIDNFNGGETLSRFPPSSTTPASSSAASPATAPI